MKVTAIYKIDDSYVIGDDKKIYRLPYSEGKRSYKLKPIKQHRNGFFLHLEFLEKSQIKYESIEPYTLIDESESEYPF
jgi:hypothetical protein